MYGDNPCNICESKDNCYGCILDSLYLDSGKECYNYSCMLHYECGCLLSLDTKCKASTCYEPDDFDSEEEEDD